MELFERWAWYGVFMVLALYLTGSRDEGALGFSQIEKGTMMGVVTAILYLLPLVTGAIADKFGYKKILLLSFGILSSGYLMMGYFTSYSSMFLVFLYVAVGAALFKPVISATIAKTTDSESSSIGFGLFYMMVNVGGFIGPIFAGVLRGMSWQYVFIMASIIIALNFILVIFFFKEPEREENTESLGASIKKVFNNIVEALSDYKLSFFLIIMVGFWTMFNQLFYTLPNFVEQWVDTRMLHDWIAGFSEGLASGMGKNGQINPEYMLNLDAGGIVLFQVLVSTIIMRFKPLNAMMGGIFIASMGIGFSFATANPFYALLAIVIFAFGEMSSSPKFTEYIGRIAPKGKEALYMGTSFLPVAVGNYLAGIFSGPVYQNMSDKITLLQREVAAKGYDVPAISDTFTQNQYIEQVCQITGYDEFELTAYLWETYEPSSIWVIFTSIGLVTVLLLFLYDKYILKDREPAKLTE